MFTLGTVYMGIYVGTEVPRRFALCDIPGVASLRGVHV